MENLLNAIMLVIVGGFGLFLLYHSIKNWKFVLAYLLMPLAGMLVMAFILVESRFNSTIHPLVLGMASVAIGGLLGHWLALRKNWV